MVNNEKIIKLLGELSQNGYLLDAIFTNVNGFKFKMTVEQIQLLEDLIKVEDYDSAYRIAKSIVPDVAELGSSKIDIIDGIGEENIDAKPTDLITQFYPDRVLLFVSNKCYSNCRFCFRRRKITNGFDYEFELQKSLDYLHRNKNIKEVIISGGDPLVISNEKINYILSNLRKIEHLKVIRIDTKTPIVKPSRIDDELLDILKKNNVQYLIMNIIHPKELTNYVIAKLNELAYSGVSLGSHTPLLKNINDHAEIIKDLMIKLYENRVRPYYLINFIPTKWTSHFWVPIERGIEIIEELWGDISGLATPTFIIYLPNSKGKIPFMPHYLIKKEGNIYWFKNYKGEIVKYIDGLI